VDKEQVRAHPGAEEMLQALFGNGTAARLMLYLHHHGEAYATAVAREMRMAVVQVQRQLDRFEFAGWLVAKRVGSTRVYSFNPAVAGVRKLTEMLRVFHDAMPREARERLFPVRTEPLRPRRRDVPGEPSAGTQPTL
jgi:hypothetical protein